MSVLILSARFPLLGLVLWGKESMGRWGQPSIFLGGRELPGGVRDRGAVLKMSSSDYFISTR